MFQKYKIPIIALALVWLSTLACTLTQAPSPTVLVASPVRLITTVSPTPSLVPTCHVQTNVSNGQLNLRAGPGTQYDVIVVLHEDDIFAALSTTNDWIMAKTNDHQGWVNSHYAYCNNPQGGQQ